ncbi:hypothetical protein [Flavobacterium hiemivividum]|uniref:DUF3592 domain-containing protein n=1 Tax=Flavobacterium hiemivividum TaxID=2541734 RepID=A0A4R5CVA6_9FLAO|nr:hypothetical protein [Flavobacterium hiemivividum]TDE02931.1 hypothetical protein E0F98_12170 [Flavobacterium hiemivividum]
MKEEGKINFKYLKIAIVITFISSTIILLYTNHKENQFDDYKKTFKGEAIGLTMKFKKSGRSRYLMYCFYVNSKIVSNTKTIGNDEILKKFYKVKYDLNNPKANYILLDKELKPDSLALVKAGFTKTKYYIYDSGITSKYLERSKWK